MSGFYKLSNCLQNHNNSVSLELFAFQKYDGRTCFSVLALCGKLDVILNDFLHILLGETCP